MALKSKAMRKGGRKVRKTLKNKKYKKGGSVENTPGAKPVQHNTLGNMMHGISSGFKGIRNMMGLRKPHEHSGTPQPGAPQPGAPQPGVPQPVPPQQGGRKVRKSKKHRKGGMFGIGEKPKTTYERAKEGMQHMGHNMHEGVKHMGHNIHEGAKHMGHNMHEGAKHMYQNITHHNQHAGKRKTKRNTKRKYSKAKKSRKN
tara:strand:+ start:12 stop:611 length:600 start_codon:yes stop_codon:yes gene_type:complete